MTIIGSASVQIRAVDRYFEKDVRAAVGKIKNLNAPLKADLDLTKVNKKLRDLRHRLRTNAINIPSDINMSKVDEKVKKLREKSEKELMFVAKANTKGAITALEAVKARFAHSGVPFTAHANTGPASAALQWLTRPRSVSIFPVLDHKSGKAVMGLLHTLSGTLPVDKMRDSIQLVAADFESLAVKGASVVSTLGSVSSALLTLGADAVSISDDLLQLTGWLAMAPALIGALGAVVATNVMAWSGFTDAVGGSEEALANLTPVAREAALALKGTGEAIATPVQEAFWEPMGTSLQDMVHSLLPALISGLSAVGSTMGDITSIVLDEFAKIGNNGVLREFLSNTNEMLKGVREGVQPVTEALITLGRVGGEYLPDLGKYLGDLGEQFGAFIEKADKAGRINDWIETATRRFQELVSIGGSVGDIFSALARAADISGAAGLTDFANGLADIADIVSSEPFQSRLISILKGAREGARRLGQGFQDLAQLVGESADEIGLFLTITGDVTGVLLTRLTDLFSGTGLGTGLMEALYGARDALLSMEPAFSSLGSIIGDLGEIAGELFVNMAPGLNQFMETVEGVIARLKDGIIAAMPVINDFVQAVLHLVQGPIFAFAEGIGNLLEYFAELPGVVQTAILSFGTFLLLKNRFAGFFAPLMTGLNAFLTRAGLIAPKVQSQVSKSQIATRRMGIAWAVAGRQIGAYTRGIATVGPSARRVVGPVESASARAKKAFGSVTSAVGATAKAGLRGAIGGVGALLGGPWGIAIAGATLAIGAYAQAQAESKARVQELTKLISEQTGELNRQGEIQLGMNLLDGETNWFDDFVRGGKKVGETLDIVGTGLDEVSEKLADPSSREQYISDWEKVRDSLLRGKEVSEGVRNRLRLTNEELDQLSMGDVNHLVGQMKGVAEEAARAEGNVSELGEAEGVTSVKAQALAKNFETLASETSTASSKFSALKQNMDILNGSQMSALDTQRNYRQSVLDTTESLKGLAKANGGTVKGLVGAKGAFKFATQAGIDFYDTMKSSADSILKLGTNTYDSVLKTTGSAQKAQKAAVKAMQGPIDSLKRTLSDMGATKPQIQGILDQLGLLKGDFKAALGVTGAEAAQQKILATKVMAVAYANGNFEAMLAALPGPAKKAIEQTHGLAGAFARGDYKAILKALDKTKGGRLAALAAIAGVTDGEYLAMLRAKNLVAPPAKNATLQIRKYFKGKDVDLDAINKAKGPVAKAQAVINTLKGIEVDADVRNQTKKPINMAQNIIDSLRGKEVDAKAVEKAEAAVRRAQQYINSLDGKWVNAEARERARAAVAAAQRIVDGFHGKTVTVEVVTKYTSSGKKPGNLNGITYANADGGMYSSAGVKTFADGGLLEALGAKKFANGSENHVAQIARGGWPYRIWAEPETGGEAYIPLSESKRDRSLEILRKVADKFGYGLFKSFADGGIMAGFQSNSNPSPVSLSSGGANTSHTSSFGSDASTPNIMLQVNPSPGMDEEAIGRIAANDLYWNLINR